MIRVLIIDDHTLVREGLCKLLESQEGIQVVARAGTGREAVELCRTHEPQVVLLDYSLPDMDGLESTAQIVALKTGAKVLILTMHQSEEYAIRVIRAGASGFVVKGASPEELLAALKKVAAGGTYVSPVVLEKMVGRMSDSREDSPESKLSDREIQVLIRLARGTTTREVSQELCLSVSTVETYRSRILEKLSLRNNSDITRFAIRRGLIVLGD